jgi:hypothetical protein
VAVVVADEVPLRNLTVHICPACKREFNSVTFMPGDAKFGTTAAGNGGGLSQPQPASTEVVERITALESSIATAGKKRVLMFVCMSFFLL